MLCSLYGHDSGVIPDSLCSLAVAVGNTEQQWRTQGVSNDLCAPKVPKLDLTTDAEYVANVMWFRAVATGGVYRYI